MVPLSQALKRLVQPLSYMGLAKTLVLGADGRAYVLLAGAINGTMQPLARLLWQARNEISPPFKP